MTSIRSPVILQAQSFLLIIAVVSYAVCLPSTSRIPWRTHSRVVEPSDFVRPE
ncbi:hypothetical protein OH76DRAFT_1402617 [Lentinus brumalis]|uniref:Uncharacterized protein n=1 Tax=Lentinus brumalis TaxID=2498619 RepID=A0A371DDG6_9APHY|nr:hypothetical protein OH76DRAFT_1402617 [Polyporus brumalis]